MPIGIQRINAKKSHPNERIIFIKPLPGPNEKIARDFLERIAAQCLPIMKDNSLSVMSLEEYEPNREFVGRNFNAGEVIQLVLKTRAGRWLPFEYVQMVMMHELAHCKQMNHSRAFWAVRNAYADSMRALWSYVQMVMMHELAHCKQMNHSRAFWAVRNAYADSMRALWSRGYTGDGLWGRGTLLASGAWAGDTAPLGEGLPEHLCGGTFRSRGRRKRKAKPPRLSYREQKERRILKKFGANGVALGADEAVKTELEKGRKTAAKPRVAGSARGRELRAAAALARFGQQKVEHEEEDDDDDEERLAKSENVSEDESDYEDDVADIKREDAIDLNGQRLLDKDGRGMIKVCEDENPDDQDAQQELQELRSVKKWTQTSLDLRGQVAGREPPPQQRSRDESSQRSQPSEEPKVKRQPPAKAPTTRIKREEAEDDAPVSTVGKATSPKIKAEEVTKESFPGSTIDNGIQGDTTTSVTACGVCSFANPELSITCSPVFESWRLWRVRGVRAEQALERDVESVECLMFGLNDDESSVRRVHSRLGGRERSSSRDATMRRHHWAVPTFNTGPAESTRHFHDSSHKTEHPSVGSGAA
ncbi:hypothetical protein BN1723_009342 [Verticillium longisporum]|uniref:WLM domain-containing protein n=1 Tax=Verticillium longisporum TaxID=100787 RepID=A0A0G4KP96_VERLO|nr:hypothetical protein BN1723_009342 [Verticillium longisporum]